MNFLKGCQMKQLQMKLENPTRMEELKPEDTLRRIGLQENHVLSDIGAGSGIFAIPAAKITSNTVYALDINEDMLSLINDKAKREGITNIETVKVENEHFNLDSHTVDIAILVTVFHEIDNKSLFLSEVKRILNGDGKIAVIEFHKRNTPMGPRFEHRLGKGDLIKCFEDIEFVPYREFDLGENFYCLVFAKA